VEGCTSTSIIRSSMVADGEIRISWVDRAAQFDLQARDGIPSDLVWSEVGGFQNQEGIRWVELGSEIRVGGMRCRRLESMGRTWGGWAGWAG